MNINNGHSKSGFSHSFDFNCLTNFAKGINLFCKAFLWYELSRKRPINTSKSTRWIPLGWAKFELECLLITWIYFNFKFKDFECRSIKTHSEEKSLKFVLFHSPFCFLLDKILLLTWPFLEVWSQCFVIRPSNAFQKNSFLPKQRKI